MTYQQKLSKYLKYNEQSSHYSMSIEQMALIKTELIWLYNFLEVKGSESESRGKKMSDEYKQSIDTVKRSSLFITQYCIHVEKLQNEIAELKRRNEYLLNQLPKVDFSKLKIHYENGKLIYKQNNVNNF